MRTPTFLAILALAGITTDVMAHGENKPGPHGGYVRMPGGFHTEIVLQKKTLEVYLLDIEFKNPTIAKSSVTAIWRQKSTETELSCRAEADRFICDLPKLFSSKKGSLILTTKRVGMVGGLARYDLPLPAFSKSKSSKAADQSEHSAHHE